MTIPEQGYGTEELIELLKLEKIEKNLYRGNSRDLGYGHLFGGQVVSQGLSAAAATVTGDLRAHSIHCNFMQAGDTRKPIVYNVQRLYDGTSFANRQVTALQTGVPIVCLCASFHRAEPGFDHHPPMPEVPLPECLEDETIAYKNFLGPRPPKPLHGLFTEKPIEFRMATPVHPLSPEPAAPERHFWFKARTPLPDNAAIHQAVLAFATDFYLASTSLRPYGKTFWSPDMMVASLDHSIWFHREFRMDDWLLHAVKSPNASNGRGISFGRVYTRNGNLVASVAQESLIRRMAVTPDMLHP